MYKINSSELENSRWKQGSKYQPLRTSYYTRISFKYKDYLNRVEMKVDTGAAHTIIGTDYKDLSEQLKEDIQDLPIDSKRTPEDASGHTISLKECTVENFRLTPEIVFPKIKIMFSSDIKDKAILGMDILSLFDFQYKHEKGNMLGTFWINNWEHHLKKIFDILEKKHLDYLDTEQIFLLDETEEQSNHRINLQELEANLIHNKLTEKK
jgi:hypothetical protein